MFTIFCQKGILIFCFLHIDHNIKLYPWTIAEGRSKKMKNYECPGQGPLCDDDDDEDDDTGYKDGTDEDYILILMRDNDDDDD